jgi:hypothetical protein
MPKISIDGKAIYLLECIRDGKKYHDISRLKKLVDLRLASEYPCNQFGEKCEHGNYSAYKITELGMNALKTLK